jgi:hypothetical protein
MWSKLKSSDLGTILLYLLVPLVIAAPFWLVSGLLCSFQKGTLAAECFDVSRWADGYDTRRDQGARGRD